MKVLRIYLDTSVIGGCLDPEFEFESRRTMLAIARGHARGIVSRVLLDELALAPRSVQDVLTAMPPQYIDRVDVSAEVLELRDAYLKAGVLTAKSINDATHVALATVHRADAIVSWNFKHIVRLDKIKGFNQVNLMMGYGILTIISPNEVIFDEDEGNA